MKYHFGYTDLENKTQYCIYLITRITRYVYFNDFVCLLVIYILINVIDYFEIHNEVNSFIVENKRKKSSESFHLVKSCEKNTVKHVFLGFQSSSGQRFISKSFYSLHLRKKQTDGSDLKSNGKTVIKFLDEFLWPFLG